MPIHGDGERDADVGQVAYDPVEFRFSGEVVEWRGPAPYYFVRVPADASEEIYEETHLSYGWGMIPSTLTVGRTTWYTALWRKDGGYLIPFKDKVRMAEDIHRGDVVDIVLRLGKLQ